MYRSEHPKPQFMRKTWENLNGIWEFERDTACSGEERGLFSAGAAYAEKKTRLVSCTLGYRAGVIGAALLAAQE